MEFQRGPHHLELHMADRSETVATLNRQKSIGGRGSTAHSSRGTGTSRKTFRRAGRDGRRPAAMVPSPVRVIGPRTSGEHDGAGGLPDRPRAHRAQSPSAPSRPPPAPAGGSIPCAREAGYGGRGPRRPLAPQPCVPCRSSIRPLLRRVPEAQAWIRRSGGGDLVDDHPQAAGVGPLAAVLPCSSTSRARRIGGARVQAGDDVAGVAHGIWGRSLADVRGQKWAATAQGPARRRADRVGDHRPGGTSGRGPSPLRLPRRHLGRDGRRRSRGVMSPGAARSRRGGVCRGHHSQREQPLGPRRSSRCRDRGATRLSRPGDSADLAGVPQATGIQESAGRRSRASSTSLDGVGDIVGPVHDVGLGQRASGGLPHPLEDVRSSSADPGGCREGATRQGGFVAASREIAG